MRVIVLSAAFGVLCLTGWAGDDVNPAEIIQKFAAKELEFQQARNNYTYRQSVKIEKLDPSGNPSGAKWELGEGIISTPDAQRIPNVVDAPVVSLRNIRLTPEDDNALRDLHLF